MYDYILNTDCRLFELLGIREMRNYSSDHFALRARLLQGLSQCHTRYLWVRLAFPLSLLAAADRSVADTKFQALKLLDLPSPP